MPQYDDEEFLDALDASTKPLASTNAVAQRVGCTPTTANRRLRALADEGEVEFMTPYPDYHESTSQNLVVRRLVDGEEPLMTRPPL